MSCGSMRASIVVYCSTGSTYSSTRSSSVVIVVVVVVSKRPAVRRIACVRQLMCKLRTTENAATSGVAPFREIAAVRASRTSVAALSFCAGGSTLWAAETSMSSGSEGAPVGLRPYDLPADDLVLPCPGRVLTTLKAPDERGAATLPQVRTGLPHSPTP